MTTDGAIVAVKVGGSLLDWPALPETLGGFLAACRRREGRPVLIVGGGRAADWVRDLDRTHALGEAKAHALAVRSLDLTALALAAIVPGLEAVETIGDLQRARRSGRVPILAPRIALDEDDRDSADPLPRSWDVTTDAIAARMAAILGAETLILLKSTAVPTGTTRDEAARLGVVDPAFPRAARAIGKVGLRNLRDPGGEVVYLG